MTSNEKQIQYWIDGAATDISTAELLIKERRWLPGLFFCHLAVEKALKAHYVKSLGAMAPKTHNLIYLS
ncbi:MAG: HEPN domain-containing protein, partial [Cytophagales bacterium]|nr:HEPN domain-containing protein [Cytophagales bacterium]